MYKVAPVLSEHPGAANSPPFEGGVARSAGVVLKDAKPPNGNWPTECNPSCMKHDASNPIFNISSKKELRKKLRKHGTSAEAVLWKYLQKRQILGKKLRRQASIGSYVVDFYCSECRVIVELDGAPHFGVAAGEYQGRRTEYLESLGMLIMRFENHIVFRNPEAVIETITRALLARCKPENTDDVSKTF
jgi:very-short-patch-repair endonuclease